VLVISRSQLQGSIDWNEDADGLAELGSGRRDAARRAGKMPVADKIRQFSVFFGLRTRDVDGWEAVRQPEPLFYADKITNLTTILPPIELKGMVQEGAYQGRVAFKTEREGFCRNPGDQIDPSPFQSVCSLN
jgi:hypothetical protein